MSVPHYDFHIHTTYLGCGNATMEVADIVAESARLGVTTMAITDHLNTLDKLPLHEPILADIRTLDTTVEVYFGVELNYTGCDGEFVYSEEIREQAGFQFAIGGIHGTYCDTFDVAKIVETQHRHHLKTCANPLVDVLVHPYWFSKGEFDGKGWTLFESMDMVPESLTRELARASKETGTALEINGSANLCNPYFAEDYAKSYVDYIAILADEGAIFSFGSDAHDLSHLANVTDVWRAAEQLHIPPEQIWRPTCAPMTGGKG